ncbi:helix-turn-helix transcriptional regulator [Litoreibacter roseus]|uniref:Histidine kinase n=1 Tax=Litoreibacter roseus TaxID=2601869 RepID=A0A6N6JAT6_9RHOB|nr:autoinducer binding domain-containing protein [Litoreibacter roseus]GFE63295.1 histidine kinase [Litoreibacter roseus]
MQDLLTQATALEELQRVTENLRDYYGVNHVVYHWVNSVGERFGCGTYTTEWVDRYVEKDYLHIDPVIIGCFQRFDPVNWKQLDWSSKAARSFLKEASDYGVGSQGFTIPVRGPNGQFALFTMTNTCSDEEWAEFIETNQRDLLLVAHTFNKKALAFEEGVFNASTPQLSPRELSAMTLLAKGRSRAQAADEMSISEHTLRVYIEAARHKLGAMNTTHAVARALAMGLIVM